ncbi:hypothetical protein [Acidimangrovimonas sediminis]|uniref:hypothetical protein n=1 Tax=Acidimangrovimonas sediminis TaxID=2056283 RepID=UPI000C7FE1F7|nr:hypothetical protein [Acidimangrovimonas sediminis]
MTGTPKPPAHIQPYVEILGIDGAIDFFLEFGGSEIYLSATPKGKSRLVQHVGAQRAQELAVAVGHLKVRIPTTKPWIAQVWHSRGLPVAEIARRLHMTDVAVRRWLKAGPGNIAPDPRQPSLF